MNNIKLNNGMILPNIGFGTWQITGEAASEAVSYALEIGYRLIDTAAIYKNEEMVGKGIKASNVKREDIIVTTKLWNSKQGYDTTLEAFDKSLKKLDLDYVDLYLIHWPIDSMYFPKKIWKEKIADTWKAFERLLDEGLIKGIGVCNFLDYQLEYLLSICNTKPVLDQIELHPGHPQSKTIGFAKANDIAIEAWSPIGSGRLLENSDLKKIAEKYNTSVASICLSYCKNKGAIILPKSANKNRILSNLQDENYTLTEEDMSFLDNMEDVGYSTYDPDDLNPQ